EREEVGGKHADRPHISQRLVDTRKPPPVEEVFVPTEGEMAMYAVIRSGGKQYRVAPGETIRLEKLAGEVGTKVELGDVLLVENDGNVQVGTPVLTNAKIE